MLLSSALALGLSGCFTKEKPTGYVVDFEKASYTESIPVNVRQVGNWEFDSGMALLALPGYGEFALTRSALPGRGEETGRLYMTATFSKNPNLGYATWKMGFKLGAQQQVQVYLDQRGRIYFEGEDGEQLASLPESRDALPVAQTGQILLELAVYNEESHTIVVTARDSSGRSVIAATHQVEANLEGGLFDTKVFIEGTGTGYLALDYLHVWPDWVPAD